MTNASEDHVNPSAVPEDDLTSSPSSLFCSSEPSATEQQTNKKENRRKSLTNLIERYRKIRQNMELKWDLKYVLFTDSFLLCQLSAFLFWSVWRIYLYKKIMYWISNYNKCQLWLEYCAIYNYKNKYWRSSIFTFQSLWRVTCYEQSCLCMCSHTGAFCHVFWTCTTTESTKCVLLKSEFSFSSFTSRDVS